MVNYVLKFNTFNRTPRVESALKQVAGMLHEIKEDAICYVQFDTITDDVERLLRGVAHLKSTALCIGDESMDVSTFLNYLDGIKTRLKDSELEIETLNEKENLAIRSLNTTMWQIIKEHRIHFFFFGFFVIVPISFLPLVYIGIPLSVLIGGMLFLVILSVALARLPLKMFVNDWKKNQKEKLLARENLSEIRIKNQKCKEIMLTIYTEYCRKILAEIPNNKQKSKERVLPALLFFVNSFLPEALVNLLDKVDFIDLHTLKAILPQDESRFREFISDTFMKYGFSFDGDHLVVKNGFKGDFAKNLSRMLEHEMIAPLTLDSFRSVFKDSNQIPLGTIKYLLHLDQAAFDTKIIDLAIEFGLIIDGDNLDARDANLDGFFTELAQEIKKVQ
ncbi:MAG TPA: hypothetical protein VKM55_00090 [Candidatus Lokiarchaeia archaeon]|nr:hypothetical protein [Candidatus Lokiarchaeia archaeon]